MTLLRRHRTFIIRTLALSAMLLMAVACFDALHHVNPEVIYAIKGEEAHHHVLSQQPYTLDKSAAPSRVSIVVASEPEQNSVMEIEARAKTRVAEKPEPVFKFTDVCVARAFIAPAGRAQPVELSFTPQCGHIVINLANHLADGRNILTLELTQQTGEVLLFVKPMLFGTHAASSLFCLLLLALGLAAFFMAARASGLKNAASGLATAGLAYFALWLHTFPNLAYTNDLFGHIAYIAHMVNHWSQPYGYTGKEYFHPPLYYFLAARVFAPFIDSPVISHLAAARILSLFFYAIFCVIGLHTIKEMRFHHKPTQIAVSVLFIFWPLSILLATRITNDVALYAVWAGVFHYVLRAYQTKQARYWQLAVVWLGVAFMIKTTAAIPALIVVLCAAYAVATKQLAPHMLLTRSSIGAGGTLAFGLLFNLGRPIYTLLMGTNTKLNYFGESIPETFAWMHFLRFHPIDLLFAHPFVWTFSTKAADTGFLDYLLQSMLFGEFTWDMRRFAGVLLALLFMWLGIIAAGLAGQLRAHTRSAALVPGLISIGVCMIALVIFTMLKHMPTCQDFRFIYPVIIPLLLLYGLTLDRLWERRRRLLYWPALGVGCALALAGVVFYLEQTS